jgi:hypothetical protein
MLRLNLWSYPRASCCTGPTGATSTRLSLRPLLSTRVERDAKLGRKAPRERELASLAPPSCPAKAGHPVSGGLSAQALRPLEYWIVRSSRTMTAESYLKFESEPHPRRPSLRQDDSGVRRERHCGAAPLTPRTAAPRAPKTNPTPARRRRRVAAAPPPR